MYCPCGTLGAKTGYVLELLVHGKVLVGKFSSLIVYYEKKNMAIISITERAQSFSCIRKLQV